MFRLAAGLKVYLHREAIDGRKNINGLALLVEQDLGLDPFAAAVYVFSNRRRNRIKRKRPVDTVLTIAGARRYGPLHRFHAMRSNAALAACRS